MDGDVDVRGVASAHRLMYFGHHGRVALELVRPANGQWPVEVLTLRKGPLKYGEAAVVLIPGEKGQRHVRGRIYSSFGGDERPWAALKIEVPVHFTECVGAPVLDAAGLLAGMIVADDAPQSTNGPTTCLSIERPEEAPELER